jgi:uncharacterized protein (DUF302 family)
MSTTTGTPENTVDDGIAIKTTQLSVEHVTLSTPRPYTEVKRELESRLGRLDDSIRAMLRNNDLDGVRTALKKAAGKDDLAIHYIGLHGDWLALAGERKNTTAYLIGNVLYAVQMTSVNVAAGNYAPLRVVLYENASGGSTFEYDNPSTLFGQFGEPAIDKVAATLDQRLSALLLSLCRGPQAV